MKIKTADLIGRLLDWAVAVSLGGTGLWYDTVGTWWIKVDGKDRALSSGWSEAQNFNPSTNWAQGGPIKEREGIATRRHSSCTWYAMLSSDLGDHARPEWTEFTMRGGKRYGKASYEVHPRQQLFKGDTELIAAMRCFVASKLGDEVDVPKELVCTS